MHASTVPGTNSPQLAQMVSQESTTYSQAPAYPCFKVTKMKFQKSASTLRATRLSQPAAIRHAGFGPLKLAMRSKSSKATRMRSFHVHSTMRVTPSSRDRKTTPVESGKTNTCLKD
jgi:Cu/Zn superoxide dismutase